MEINLLIWECNYLRRLIILTGLPYLKSVYTSSTCRCGHELVTWDKCWSKQAWLWPHGNRSERCLPLTYAIPCICHSEVSMWYSRLHSSVLRRVAEPEAACSPVLDLDEKKDYTSGCKHLSHQLVTAGECEQHQNFILRRKSTQTSKMKIRVVQIWGFLMTVLGWIFTACTMAMEGWKITSIGGMGGSSIIKVAWYWSSLWRSCFTDSTAVSNCYDYPVLWSVEGW